MFFVARVRVDFEIFFVFNQKQLRTGFRNLSEQRRKKEHEALLVRQSFLIIRSRTIFLAKKQI